MDTGVLEQIWAVLPEGYVFLPRIKGWKVSEKGKLKAEAYKEGSPLTPAEAIKRMTEWDTTGIDMYFTPLTYKDPSRSIECVNPSRVLFADLDDCDPRVLPEELKPTTYWKSSESHYQGMWLLDKALPPDEFADLNKRLSYAVGADKSGWDLTQILRVPGSVNYKYGDPEPCTLLHHSTTPISTDTLLTTLDAYSPKAGPADTDWPVPKRVIDLLNATEFPVGERSERLWELEKTMVESGMPVAEIFRLLKTSGWNKFTERRDGDTALLKDIMKAEAECKVEAIEKTTAAKPPLLTDFYKLVTSNADKPSYMVEGFLVDKSVGVAAGEPKTMKSTVVLDLAVSVASGKPFLGRYPVNRTGAVLYIQEENSSADIMFRLQRIALHHGVATQTSVGVAVSDIPLYIINNEGLNLTEQTDRDRIEDIIREYDIQLLLLDPWYMMVAGIDEDRSKEVSPVLKYLTSLRNKYECTILLVHHFKKGDTVRPGQRMRGSSVFHAWVETGLYFSMRKGKPGEITVDREFRSVMSRGKVQLTFAAETTEEYDVLVEEDGLVTVGVVAPIVKTVQVMGSDDDENEDGEAQAVVAKGTPTTWDECIRAGMSLEDTLATAHMSKTSLVRAVAGLIQKGKLAGVFTETSTDFSGLEW